MNKIILNRNAKDLPIEVDYINSNKFFGFVGESKFKYFIKAYNERDRYGAFMGNRIFTTTHEPHLFHCAGLQSFITDLIKNGYSVYQFDKLSELALWLEKE